MDSNPLDGIVNSRWNGIQTVVRFWITGGQKLISGAMLKTLMVNFCTQLMLLLLVLRVRICLMPVKEKASLVQGHHCFSKQ